MNGSRNESTARKMARGKTQTAAERRACIKSHRKFIWFGKIRVPAREIPLAPQKSYQNIVFLLKTLHLRRFWGASWESRGIDRAESTVRKMARKKIKFLFRVFCFSRKWPVGTSILLESGFVLEFSTAKTLESGIVLTPKRLRVVSFLNLGYQFRLGNSWFLTLK